MSDMDYKAAYERQKKARAKAEELLENRSRELYESNQSLMDAYQKLKDQKAQILHQEKLASIGQLSAGVAHEINNPAGYVKSNLSSLKNYLDGITRYFSAIDQLFKEKPEIEEKILALKKKHDFTYIMEDIDELAGDSIEGMERISSIVNSLKDFARQDEDEARPFSLNKCIENTIKLANNQIKYHASVEKTLEDIPDYTGHQGSMGQVFLNLLVNAAQAIEKNGIIKIHTMHKNNDLVVTIQDNGKGIPKNIQRDIFNPFFTTKEVGEGTGLGLAISESIIRKHGGTIHVDSELGEGTRFTIHLPIKTH